jgi:hypothetical protein
METFQFLGFGIDAWITIVTVLGVFAILTGRPLLRQVDRLIGY